MAEPRILIAEDEPGLARGIRQTLRRSGYVVPEVVTSGEDAVASAEANHPDLVLLDIALQGKMDAVEAGDWIRRSLHVPVVYLTARGDPEAVERASASAPAGFIQEPEERRELLTIVELACRRGSEKLRLAGEGFLGMFQDTTVPLAIATPGGRVIETNRAFQRLLGDESGALAGMFDDLIAPEDRARHRSSFLDLESGRTDHCQMQVRLLRRDGDLVQVDLTAFVLRNPRGVTRFCIQLHEDVGVSSAPTASR